MNNAAQLVVAALAAGLVIGGCKKSQEEAPAQQPYGQAQPGYGQQPQTPAQSAPQQPAPQTTPTAPPGTLSQPGPAALPCQTDATCIFARCNTAAGKCVFPCQNDRDCIAPNQCILGTGLCAPALGVAAGGRPAS